MLALGGAPLSSPKQTTVERHSSLFPYYAGFSEAFVSDVLDALQPTTGEVVLDPWNGSGTNTRRGGSSRSDLDRCRHKSGDGGCCQGTACDAEKFEFGARTSQIV